MKFAFFDGFYVMQPLKKGVHYTSSFELYTGDLYGVSRLTFVIGIVIGSAARFLLIT